MSGWSKASWNLSVLGSKGQWASFLILTTLPFVYCLRLSCPSSNKQLRCDALQDYVARFSWLAMKEPGYRLSSPTAHQPGDRQVSWSTHSDRGAECSPGQFKPSWLFAYDLSLLPTRNRILFVLQLPGTLNSLFIVTVQLSLQILCFSLGKVSQKRFNNRKYLPFHPSYKGIRVYWFQVLKVRILRLSHPLLTRFLSIVCV